MHNTAGTPWTDLSLFSLLTIAIIGGGSGATSPGIAGEETAVSASRPAPAEAAVRPEELRFEEIVFVKRKPFSSDHYYTDINNGTSPDRFLPDNGIYIYNVRTRSERPVVTAAALPGGQGLVGKISLSFDAKNIVFDFRQDPGSGFRIWEVATDGTGLRQISFPPKDEAEKVARWHQAGTPTTSTPAICRTAGSSSPRLVPNTRCCAAGRRTSWPRLCTAWMPTARMSNSSRIARSANSAP